MIVFFGPAGAGKSVQGQLLAERKGWHWLSAGQLLRDKQSDDLSQVMKGGDLVDSEKVNQVVGEALSEIKDKKIVIDGFPRQLPQAEWLIDNNFPIDLVVVLEVSKEEIMKRLAARGRVDDVPEVIEKRLNEYREKMHPILDYFIDKNIKISYVDGMGSIDQVHEKIVEELTECQLI